MSVGPAIGEDEAKSSCRLCSGGFVDFNLVLAIATLKGSLEAEQGAGSGGAGTSSSDWRGGVSSKELASSALKRSPRFFPLMACATLACDGIEERRQTGHGD